MYEEDHWGHTTRRRSCAHQGRLPLSRQRAQVAGPAASASADDSAQQTISQLQQQGYTVNIDRLGTAPMSQCIVTGVRNPQTVTQWVPYVGPRLGRNNGNFLVPVITSQTISVSLDCTGKRGHGPDRPDGEQVVSHRPHRRAVHPGQRRRAQDAAAASSRSLVVISSSNEADAPASTCSTVMPPA